MVLTRSMTRQQRQQQEERRNRRRRRKENMQRQHRELYNTYGRRTIRLACYNYMEFREFHFGKGKFLGPYSPWVGWRIPSVNTVLEVSDSSAGINGWSRCDFPWNKLI